jgi:Glycosyl transferase family 2
MAPGAGVAAGHPRSFEDGAGCVRRGRRPGASAGRVGRALVGAGGLRRRSPLRGATCYAAPTLPRALIDVVVPAQQAESTIAAVVRALPRRELRSVVVVDRASRDRTAERARDLGAIALRSEAGYGAACLRALEHFVALPEPPHLVVFVPGDDEAAAAEAPRLIAPLRDRGVELCLGVRGRAPWGDRLLSGLIEAVYRQRVAGLGSVRAIRYAALVALGMSDRGGGWDVEMMVRAVKLGLTMEQVILPGPAVGRRLSGRALFHIARHSTMR